MLKIYVQNKPLFLISEINNEVEEYMHRDDTIFMDNLGSSSVTTMLRKLESENYYAGVILHTDLDELLATLKSYLTLIIAAGGLVHTKNNELLLIFRKGKWDLPKGKLDDGENLEECAVREIGEETGATKLSIESPLHVTYHTYYERWAHILKESHWFLISAHEKSILKPQLQEDISECKWVSIDDLENYMDNTHASIIDVINAGRKKLTAKNS
jgi:8-oxo-dGTP pyrophosphatase MutT (NUDIX family)